MDYDQLLRLALERGFFAPSCELYGDSPAGFWEYGPIGLALRNRFVELWRREILRRDDMVEIDGSQIMSKSVFEASGHLQSFSDPVITCSKCRSIYRADRLIQESTGQTVPERLKNSEFDRAITDNKIKCPSCGGHLGKTEGFNMMFKIGIGPSQTEAYLRPETCQSIFVDFPRLFKTLRRKLPVAFAQYGKSFRNEIAPRQGFMRLREFYQAEIEVFFNVDKVNSIENFDQVSNQVVRILRTGTLPEEISLKKAVASGIIPNKLFGYYLGLLHQFYDKTGLDMSKTRFRELSSRDRAFYADFSIDFEVETSLGWIELVACNYRTDYDLRRHSEVSKRDLSVMDDETRVLPHIFELSMGVDRSIYSIMEHAFEHDGERNVMRFRAELAPVQVGIFPLVTKEGLPERAEDLHAKLKMIFDAVYDKSGSIGRRYRRLDEIGSPACVTVDHRTLKDDTVTIRDRDSMKQTRVKSSRVEEILTDIMRGRKFPSLSQVE